MLGLLVNRWILGGLFALLVVAAAYWKGHIHGSNSVQEKWDAEKVVKEREAYAVAEKLRETEREMQTRINKIQREKANATKIATTRYNSLVDSLRHRPEARSNDAMSSSAGADVGCTGAGLARSDAEFLAGFAADAAKLQAAYDSCRAGYEVIYGTQHPVH